MTSEKDRQDLIDFMHGRNEFDYDECQHGFYSGPFAGEKYAMCERQADALIRAGYGLLEAGPEIEWGTRWPLSEEAHGPGKTVIYPEESRKAAEALIADDREAAGRAEDLGVLVWRTAPGRWQDVPPLAVHKRKRKQLKEAKKALAEFEANDTSLIQVTDNQRRLAEALRAIIGDE